MNRIDESCYQAGYTAALDEYCHGEPVGNPIGVHDDYLLGWWCGAGDVMVWHEGWEAAEKGVMVCPYLADADDDCLREPWYDGYWDCVTTLSFKKLPALQ